MGTNDWDCNRIRAGVELNYAQNLHLVAEVLGVQALEPLVQTIRVGFV
jgi:hypothetical protein